MALPKQPISLVFGATDQDTSGKKVQAGDLVIAQNVRQVKGGEFSKRDGFTQVAHSYAGAETITPDSIVSPDGTQVLTRDAATDHVYARSTSNSYSQDQGHADRFVPHVRTRFPATASGQQVAPMAKQAGNYVVRILDEGHFKIAQLNPTTSAESHSPDEDAETVITESVSLSVSTISSAASARVDSFAVVDYATWDANNLWILWVDWSGSIYAWKVPHTNLNTGTFYTVYTRAPATTYYPAYTSICAGMVSGSMAVAACGVLYDTDGHGGEPSIGFRLWRSTPTANASNRGTSISVHFYLNKTTGLPEVAYTPVNYTDSTVGTMTAAACTILSVDGFQTSASYWYYAFIGNVGGYPAVVVIEVIAATLAIIGPRTRAFVLAAPDTYGLPADWSAANYSHYGWFYDGQLAGKETATGIDIAVTMIPYYCPTLATFKAWNPDYLFTECYSVTTGGTWTLKWKKLGACIAAGWIRLRDYASTATSGKDYLLTTWEDKEALQTCYHLREWETGEILAQLAYGQAAHVGHTGTRDTQVVGYCSDIQHPMLMGVNQYADLPLCIPVGLQSANVNGCVDVAMVLLQHYDFLAAAKPIWQNPVEVMGFALAPGPIPTIYNGFQLLREAGPLVYPSRPESYAGAGSS